jgi:hypothetical protein
LSDPQPRSTPDYAAYFVFRFVQFVLIAALALITYTQGVDAYRMTQQVIVKKAEADNAEAKQYAEALLLSEQAKTALATAQNAAIRTRAEADAVEAEADKLQAEAATLKEKAANAKQQAAADARKAANEAELRKAELIAGIAELRNVARKEKAEVEGLEAKALTDWALFRSYGH